MTPVPTPASTPVLILGMHRSGTSCLAGSLQQRGLHLGEVYESRPHNRKGNREHQRVMDTNNAVLACSQGSWDDPPAELRWDRDCVLARESVVRELEAGSNGRPWGFKDPRTLLTLPFWLERLPHPRMVGTYRHPASVARSLMARGGRMPLAGCLQLWLEYNQRLLALHAAAPFPIVCFDAGGEAYVQAVERVASRLGLAGRPPGEGEFFEDELRTRDPPPDTAIPSAHARVLERLEEAALAWS